MPLCWLYARHCWLHLWTPNPHTTHIQVCSLLQSRARQLDAKCLAHSCMVLMCGRVQFSLIAINNTGWASLTRNPKLPELQCDTENILNFEPGRAAHTYNPNTQKAEAGK
jgi:hypothetical protein